MASPRSRAALASLLFLILPTISCTSMSESQKPIPLVPSVDLPRYMGDWYVIGNIPTFIEKEAYNAVETYSLNEDGTIGTTFRYRKGGFDQPVKVHHPKGFVRENTGNALWGMQFFWPIKGEFRIAYLDADYQVTIVARTKRDYVWLMSRSPEMSDADYERFRQMIAAMGYDLSKLRRVPQQWPETAPPG